MKSSDLRGAESTGHSKFKEEKVGSGVLVERK